MDNGYHTLWANLTFLARPYAPEILMFIHRRDGSASLTDLLAAGFYAPMIALRSLATARAVRAPGTFDTELAADTVVTLTTTGVELAEILTRIEGSENLRDLLSERADWRTRLRRVFN